MVKTKGALPETAGQNVEKLDPKVRAIFQGISGITEANFYSIERYDKTKREYITVQEPDAKALQFFANEKGGIATQIIDAGANDEKAWCRLRGWPKNDPGHVKEEQVTIVFQTEIDRLILNRIRHGCGKNGRHPSGCPFLKDTDGQPKYGNNGLPILELPYEMFDVLDQAMRVKTFGERMATTKCEARLHKKFLNMEWRDPEEIEHEQGEVATASGKPLPEPTKEQPQTATEPETKPKKGPRKVAQPETKAEPEKKAETPKSEPVTVPRAHIPTDEEMQAKAQTEDAAKAQPAPAPKTVKERVAVFALRVGCSSEHMVKFFTKILEVDDLKKVAKEKFLIVLSTCETVVAQKKVNPLEFGAYIRGENVGAEMVENFTKLLKEMLR